MIKQETIIIGKRTLLKTYSDTYYIKQKETGNIYDAAIDVIPCKYHYVETEEKLPVEKNRENAEDSAVADADKNVASVETFSDVEEVIQ